MDILIRGLDEKTAYWLKAIAAVNHRSVNAEIKMILKEISRGQPYKPKFTVRDQDQMQDQQETA